MNKNSGFSIRLKGLRQKQKLSQTELGQKINTHYTNIGKYERGESLPSANKLRQLAEVLRVTTDYLIEGKIIEVAKTKLEDKDLLQMFTEIEQFDQDDKDTIKKLIDAFIAKKKIQNLVNV